VQNSDSNSKPSATKMETATINGVLVCSWVALFAILEDAREQESGCIQNSCFGGMVIMTVNLRKRKKI